MDLLILKYLLFSLFGPTTKKILHTHTHTHTHIYIYIYRKTETKSNSMKMYKYEKAQSLQRMLLFFVNVKHFGI